MPSITCVASAPTRSQDVGRLISRSRSSWRETRLAAYLMVSRAGEAGLDHGHAHHTGRPLRKERGIETLLDQGRVELPQRG